MCSLSFKLCIFRLYVLTLGKRTRYMLVNLWLFKFLHSDFIKFAARSHTKKAANDNSWLSSSMTAFLSFFVGTLQWGRKVCISSAYSIAKKQESNTWGSHAERPQMQKEKIKMLGSYRLGQPLCLTWAGWEYTVINRQAAPDIALEAIRHQQLGEASPRNCFCLSGLLFEIRARFSHQNRRLRRHIFYHLLAQTRHWSAQTSTGQRV